ncbi:hypothetical protein TNCV_3381631 [Trichonephila clavipes]|nr:hypothetical protein TNCV_3381631 [Trichonephila clavipes]
MGVPGKETADELSGRGLFNVSQSLGVQMNRTGLLTTGTYWRALLFGDQDLLSDILMRKGEMVLDFLLQRDWQQHRFEPSTTKDPPCRAAMYAKSVES